MSGKHLNKSGSEKDDPMYQQTAWLNWCRLCAKKEEKNQENSEIFVKNESGKSDSELTTAIGKYFWVNIRTEDEVSKKICVECRKLMEELVSFTERINKVQTLYILLQNIKPTSASDANKLRSQCGLIDEGWEHIIKPQKVVNKIVIKEVEKQVEKIVEKIVKVERPKPKMHEKEAQTDLMIYFNSSQGVENKKSQGVIESKKSPERILEDSTKDHENDDQHLANEEMESEETFEYVIQDENGMVIEPPEKDVSDGKQNVINMAGEEKDNEREENEVEDGEEMDDSLIFKELQFKIEEDRDDEEHQNLVKKFKFSSNHEEIELEYQNSDEVISHPDLEDMEEETLEEFEIEEGEEEEDEEDYVIITESTENTESTETPETPYPLNIHSTKRGRPSLSDGQKSSLESDYRHECKECKRKYKNPNVFRKHMQSLHKIIIDKLPCLQCPHCDKECLTVSRLKQHMKLHLPADQKLTVSCPFCDRKFSQVGAMKQHVNGIHHQMKPFVCDQCGRACKTLAALNEHLLVHTDECPFECDVCHKKFKNKPRLKSHMDTHTKAVYVCPDCGLELNTRRTLLQHRLVHSDVKRFKCEFCEAAFKRSKALKNHLILHTGLRPYKCTFCDRSFSNGSNCRAHKKRSHPKELADEEARGIISEPVAVPKIEELKSAQSVVQPRKVRRQAVGLPEHLRKLLVAAEKRKKQNSSNASDDEDDPASDNYEYTDMHYEIDEQEMDEDGLEEQPDMGEECEETVIYEIIDEI